MSTLPAIYRNRIAHRVVVQYRSEPYGIHGVRVAYHYGRGIPVRYVWLPGTDTKFIAENIRHSDNGIAPENVTTRPPYYFDR